jgi:transposase
MSIKKKHEKSPDTAKDTVVSSAAGDAMGGRRPSVASPAAVDPEMGSSRRRRCFSSKEKLRILGAADAAITKGEAGAVGAILRQEGIYSSMLAEWRRQRENGDLSPKRGPKPPSATDLQAEIQRLRQENHRLQTRLTHAEQIIDLQKKISELLAIPCPVHIPLPEGRP